MIAKILPKLLEKALPEIKKLEKMPLPREKRVSQIFIFLLEKVLPKIERLEKASFQIEKILSYIEKRVPLIFTLRRKIISDLLEEAVEHLERVPQLEKLLQIPMSQRVLLLPSCLRAEQCPGKVKKIEGLICPEDCSENCILQRFTETATKLAFQGICIATGGPMALNFVAKLNPRGIIAVACHKELKEGKEVLENSEKKMPNNKPEIVVGIPLLKDGCAQTEVDEELVLKIITLKKLSGREMPG